MIKKIFHFVLVLMLSISVVPLFHAKADETKSGIDDQQKDSTTVESEETPPETDESVFSLEENRKEAMEATEDTQSRSNMLRSTLSTTSYQQTFINSVSSQAMELSKKYNLYPSVMIAQASLESNWGRSELGKAPNYNLFGIKGSYNGKSVVMKTWEYSDSKGWYQINANFAKYPSYKESLESNAKLLRNGLSWSSSYYKGTWRENTKTYKDATAWLQGRYATDNTYASKLNSLISQYNLTKYDTLYDTIKQQKNVSEDAKVVNADGHGVYSGIYNTSAASGKKLSTGAPYNNKKVKITKEGTTKRGTWVQFSVDNKLIGWMDKRAFVYYPKATNVKSLNLTGKITAGSTNGLWSEVPGTVNAKKIATTAGAYQNRDAKIIKQGQISGRTYYQFQVNGKTIGWLDKRAFHVYDAIKTQSNVNWNRTVLNADRHGVYAGVYNTSASSMNKLSTGAKYNNKKVKVIKQAQTARGTWYQFQVNGKTVGWMDKRAFHEFDAIKTQSNVNWNRTVSNADRHGVYAGVYNTSASSMNKLSTGAKYNNRRVKVIKQAQTARGTWYQFQVNGKTVGWMDKRAFHEFDAIKTQSNVNWNRTILNADRHGVYAGVYNTSDSGATKLSTGAKYNNKKVKIIKQAQTSRGTWYQFQVNGKTIGWMDKRAFFDTITSQKTMNRTVTVGNATNHGVFNGVYRTSPTVKRISLGKPYNNKRVQVLKEAVTDHATWVQFRYGKTVAWMDKKAFKY